MKANTLVALKASQVLLTSIYMHIPIGCNITGKKRTYALPTEMTFIVMAYTTKQEVHSAVETYEESYLKSETERTNAIAKLAIHQQYG